MNKIIPLLAFSSLLLVPAVSQQVFAAVLINEVDSDTPGSDNLEFVELFDGGVGNSPLDGLVLVFFNGNTDTSYLALDLAGFTTDAQGFFVIGDAGVSPDLTITTIQNGADAIALYTGAASDFPNGSPTTVVNLLDAVVYDTDDPDDAGLLSGLTPGEPQLNEGGLGDSQTDSIGRFPDGAGGAIAASSWIILDTPTPGGPNDGPPLSASIHGFAFDDLNDNGFYDPGTDTPFEGVEFTLTGIANGQPVGPLITTTDASGEFWYLDLVPGDYTLVDTVPAGYEETTTASTGSNFIPQEGQEFVWEDGAAMLPPNSPKNEINVGPALMFGYDFTDSASIHGFAFDDLNDNGFYDPGTDTPFEGVEFTLTGIANGQPVGPLITTTDASGEFWYLDLVPGDYTLVDTVPAGYEETTTASTGSNFIPQEGQEFVWEDGAAMLPPNSPKNEINVGPALMFGYDFTDSASIHGFAFDDLNDNGFYDPGTDTPFEGVEFTLTGIANGQPVGPLITTTDASGEFWYLDLVPGDYTLVDTVPAGYEETTTASTGSNFIPQEGQEFVWEDGAAMLPPNSPKNEINVGPALMFGYDFTGEQTIDDKVISGVSLPIHSISLLLAGINSSAIYLVPLIGAAIGFGIYKFRRN